MLKLQEINKFTQGNGAFDLVTTTQQWWLFNGVFTTSAVSLSAGISVFIHLFKQAFIHPKQPHYFTVQLSGASKQWHAEGVFVCIFRSPNYHRIQHSPHLIVLSLLFPFPLCHFVIVVVNSFSLPAPVSSQHYSTLTPNNGLYLPGSLLQ